MIKFPVHILTGFLIFFCSCSSSNQDQNQVEKELNAIKGKGILFGHQDDLAYGMNWSYIKGESDVKRVSGDYPALFGWELGGIEMHHSHNLDSVPFEYMREMSIKAHEMGGINTFSWHPFSVINGESSWNTESVVVKHILPGGSLHTQFKKQLDILSIFFHSLKTKDGNLVPFIFRPWHEMDGSWFWWGTKTCSAEEVKELFRFTIQYLREEKAVSSMLVAYSPDRNFESAQEYLTWYPGDEYVDILGMDNYHDFKEGKVDLVIDKLHIVMELARQKNKFSALTETGLSNVTDSLWFSQKLGKVLNDSKVSKELSYAMVWRSDPKVHFYFPAENHVAAPDARSFLHQSNILLLKDFNRLKKQSN